MTMNGPGGLYYESNSRVCRNDLHTKYFQNGNEINENKQQKVSHLFKAIKMGDVSYTCKYFGVDAVKKGKLAGYVGIKPQGDQGTNCIPAADSDKVVDNILLDKNRKTSVRTRQKSTTTKVDIVGPEGLTPLHAASTVGSLEIVHLLLSVGASSQLRQIQFKIG